jgi:hypothetical protein
VALSAAPCAKHMAEDQAVAPQTKHTPATRRKKLRQDLLMGLALPTTRCRAQWTDQQFVSGAKPS